MGSASRRLMGCPRPLREKIWQNLNARKIEWTRVVRDEIAPAQVVEECRKIVAGATWGRVLVNLKKGF